MFSPAKVLPPADSDLSPKPGHSTTPQEEALQEHQGCKGQQASSPGVPAPHSSSAMPGMTLTRSPDPLKPQSAPLRRLCHNVWNQIGVKWNSPQPSRPTVQVSKQPRTRVLVPGSRQPGHTGNQASKSILFQTGDLNRTVLPPGASGQGCCSTLQCPGQVQNTRHLLPTTGRPPPRVLTPLGLGKPAWDAPGPHPVTQPELHTNHYTESWPTELSAYLQTPRS